MPPSRHSLHAGRHLARRTLGIGAAALAVLALVTVAGCAPARLRNASALIKASEPFQSQPASPAGSLLVVGDSTAVGTGASSASQSLAGLLARDHPRLRIVNLAEDGAKFEDIARQLEGSERYDVVLIMGGANDVLRFTRQKPWRDAMAMAVQRARARAPTVILMPAGNVGNAPFFYPPVSWLMTQRAKSLHAMAREVAQADQAIYVDLYRERQADPFAQQPERMNASDHLHPSDAGYAHWYEELKRQAGLPARIAALRPGP